MGETISSPQAKELGCNWKREVTRQGRAPSRGAGLFTSISTGPVGDLGQVSVPFQGL